MTLSLLQDWVRLAHKSRCVEATPASQPEALVMGEGMGGPPSIVPSLPRQTDHLVLCPWDSISPTEESPFAEIVPI